MKKIDAFIMLILMLQACNMKPKDADISWIKNKHLDIAYSDESISQKLDIYLPDTFFGKLPVIVSIHGGAFMFGDKADGQVVPMLEGVRRGYAVISINYRLSEESKFPSQINDVKTAIRWIKANAEKYQLDSTKIALWGGSAGGNLAALAGTSGGDKAFENPKMNHPDISDKVLAVVDWYGPINFSMMDEQFKASGKGQANHSQINSPESKLLGKQLSDIPALVSKANPETYISLDDPHFFIQHGTEDKNVPAEQSINFYHKLSSVLGQDKVTFELLEGAGHGGEQFESKENLDKIFKFLDRVLTTHNNR
jgi:acetyl esterase/lipase